MELRAEIWIPGKRLTECLVNRARLQRAETDAYARHSLAQRCQQLPQAASVLPFPAPGRDLNAVDNDLPVALSGKARCLRHSRLQRHGTHPAACIGNDAVGTEIVAAVFDFQKRSCPRGKSARGQNFKRAGAACVVHAVPFLPRLRGINHMPDESLPSICADQHIHVKLSDLVRAALRIAAAHTDHGLRVQLAHAPDGVAGFFIGHGRDGAGVDDVAVADLVKAAERMAALHEQLLHGLRFVLIDLTAERIACKFHKTTKIRDYAQKRFVFFVDSIKYRFRLYWIIANLIAALLLFSQQMRTEPSVIIPDAVPIVQSIAGGFSVREFTVMFHSVNEIAQFATIANRQPFPVHFNYKDSRLDAKSILSLCALPLQTPVSVELPDRAADGSFLSDIAQFLCDPDA